MQSERCIQITDPDLLGYFEERVVLIAGLFGVDLPPRRQTLLVERPGKSPERIAVASDPPMSLVYIHEQTHFSCARYELAHDAVHEVLSQDQNVFDWVQEMFAEYLAVVGIRELGLRLELPETVEYADDIDREHRKNAHFLSLQDLMAADLSNEYPEHTYARAYVTACDLIAEIGWDQLRSLGVMIKDGKHDLVGWLNDLPAEMRRAAQSFFRATIPQPPAASPTAE